MKKTDKKNFVLLVLTLAVIIYLIYFPTLGNSFTNWDDDKYICENSSIRKVSLGNLKDMFLSFHNALYQPIVFLSYSIEYGFFRLNPKAYHSTNLVLHILNSILVMFFVYLISGRTTVSFITAILFGIHPVRVESVAWVTERKDLLYSFFFLISLISYIFFRRTIRIIYLGLSMVMFIFSLLSKPLGVTLPFVLILIDYYEDGKIDKKFISNKIPYIAFSIFLTLVTVKEHFTDYSIKQSYSFNIINNLFISPYVVVFYLEKLIYPVSLSFLYPYPNQINEKLLPVFYLFPFYSIVLFTSLFVFFRVSKTLIFGSMFFLITIFPVIQLIPIVGYELTAERFTYLPSIGLFFIIGSLWNRLFLIKPEKKKIIKQIFLTVLIIVILLFSFITRERCKVWKDSVTLWTDILKSNSGIFIAYYNRGNAYLANFQYDSAVNDYNEAIKIFPYCREVYQNRGTAYFLSGDMENALKDFDFVIKTEPGNLKAYHARAVLNYRMKEYLKARDDVLKLKKYGYEMDKEFLSDLESAIKTLRQKNEKFKYVKK